VKEELRTKLAEDDEIERRQNNVILYRARLVILYRVAESESEK